MESFAFPELPVLSPGVLGDLEPLLRQHAPIIERLWARDHTLWREDPTEIANRLGWLDAPQNEAADATAYRSLADQVVADGFTDVVVLGMGGSSLFPDVLRRIFPVGDLRLTVLDSTHPDAVARVLAMPLRTTLFCVSSKSGTTVETRSHLEAVWASRGELDQPGQAFIAVTDPGSGLAALAADRNFRAILLAPADVGGRFSAMTPFGLAPAALVGVDVDALLGCATVEISRSRSTDTAQNPGLQLGVLLATAALAGRNKVTLRFGGETSPFGDWVEQLVAESLGKDGISVVPIAGENDPDARALAGPDRIHVTLNDPAAAKVLVDLGEPVFAQSWDNANDLGAQIVRWEIATAVAAAILGVHPFDQPDVASAKAATASVLAAGPSDIALRSLDEALSELVEGDLVAVTAFVDPASPIAASLHRVQQALRERVHCAVTVGLGPRYLHSTGQLHKGGDEKILVLQVLAESAHDVEIPGEDFGFARLLRAQADGDLAALRARGRRAFRIPVSDLLAL